MSFKVEGEVEVIDSYVMDLVRKHGHTMTNSEIVQKFLPKQKLSSVDAVNDLTSYIKDTIRLCDHGYIHITCGDCQRRS